MYVVDGKPDADPYAGMVTDVWTTEKKARVVYYKWPKGEQRSWTYDKSYFWDLDYQYILTMLDPPVEVKKTSYRYTYTFKQLSYLYESDSGSL